MTERPAPGCLALPTVVHAPGEAPRELRVLYVVKDGEPEAFAPLIQYFLDLGTRASLSRQYRTTRVVGLLLTYLAAHGAGALEATPRRLFAEFVTALRCGTQHLDDAERHGLFWPPRQPRRVALDLQLLNDFTDWLSNRLGTRPLNAWRAATPAERLVALRRAEHRSSKALLGHAAYRASSIADAAWTRSIQVPRDARGSSGMGAVKAFDDLLFPRLLLEGFGLADAVGARDERSRLRNALIAILLHGGGLRVSEVFHLYPSDVSVHPESPSVALVTLYHPSEGAAPAKDGLAWRDREHYLADRWKLRPRHRVRGRFHAGWKNLALSNQDENFTRVHWFPTWWGEVFLGLYRRYIAQRPVLRHPYLFFSETKRHCGEPYTPASFKQEHARAVRRIGLIPGKNKGTTVHGHRHAYGSRLADARLPPEVIKSALHHCSLDAQDIYKQVSHAKIFACLGDATARLNGPDASARSLMGDLLS